MNKVNDLLKTFEESLKIKTKNNQIRNLIDGNDDLIEGWRYVRIDAISDLRKKIEIDDINLIDLIDYWESIVKEDITRVLYLETKMFINSIKFFIEKYDFNEQIDVMEEKYFIYENVFISLVNFLDKINFTFFGSLELIKNSVHEVNDTKLFASKHEFLTSQKAFYSFENNFLRKYCDFDKAEFYKNYLLFTKDILVNRSTVLYVNNGKTIEKLNNAYWNNLNETGFKEKFKEQITLAIMYNIIVSKIMLEKYKKITETITI